MQPGGVGGAHIALTQQQLRFGHTLWSSVLIDSGISGTDRNTVVLSRGQGSDALADNRVPSSTGAPAPQAIISSRDEKMKAALLARQAQLAS